MDRIVLYEFCDMLYVRCYRFQLSIVLSPYAVMPQNHQWIKIQKSEPLAYQRCIYGAIVLRLWKGRSRTAACDGV
jgi:hypothetical protein